MATAGHAKSVHCSLRLEPMPLRRVIPRSLHTNAPLKLDFVSQKKGEWPSRSCGDCSACSQSTHLNEKEHRCTPTRRLRTLQMRDAFGMDDSKFWLKCSVAKTTGYFYVISKSKIVSYHLFKIIRRLNFRSSVCLRLQPGSTNKR